MVAGASETPMVPEILPVTSGQGTAVLELRISIEFHLQVILGWDIGVEGNPPVGAESDPACVEQWRCRAQRIIGGIEEIDADVSTLIATIVGADVRIAAIARVAHASTNDLIAGLIDRTEEVV